MKMIYDPINVKIVYFRWTAIFSDSHCKVVWWASLVT